VNWRNFSPLQQWRFNNGYSQKSGKKTRREESPGKEKAGS
jgi:hypothetical protein